MLFCELLSSPLIVKVLYLLAGRLLNALLITTNHRNSSSWIRTIWWQVAHSTLPAAMSHTGVSPAFVLDGSWMSRRTGQDQAGGSPTGLPGLWGRGLSRSSPKTTSFCMVGIDVSLQTQVWIIEKSPFSLNSPSGEFVFWEHGSLHLHMKLWANDGCSSSAEGSS